MEYIKIKDTQHPVRVSLKAVRKWEAHTGKSISKLELVSDQLILLFYSIQQGYKVEGKTFNVTIELLEDWLDEEGFGGWFEDFAAIVRRAFNNQSNTKKK